MFGIAEIQSFLAMTYRNAKLGVVPYGYTLSFVGITTTIPGSQQLSIQANADFLLLRISHRANVGAVQNVGNKTAPHLRMLVTDSGSGEQFTSAPVDLELISSNDAKMRDLPFPRLITGKSSLNIAISSWAPTPETYAVDILFEGLQVRVYN